MREGAAVLHGIRARLALIGVLIALLGAPLTLRAAQPAAPAAVGTLVLGDISEEPAKQIRAFQPMADYLAAHLGRFGIGNGQVRIAPDLATMSLWMRSGEVHVYFGSPYPAMIMSDQTGATPILRRWKGGVAEYHSVIFARVDSGLTSPDDLKGKMVGFEDNRSTSAFFLPLVHLVRAGMKPVEKPNHASVVAKDEVGFVFTSDDKNTIHWVLSRRVAAGAVNNVTYSRIPDETRKALTILTETERVARHVVMVRPVMAQALLAAIKTSLLDIHKTSEGQAVLRVFEETARFDEFPAATELGRIREMYKLVRSR